MRAVARPCSVGNLDPANDNIPYEASFDVRELVNVDEVMEREELGPNGGVLWAMEEVEASIDWLLERLEDCGMWEYVWKSWSHANGCCRRDHSPGSAWPA